MNTRQINAKMNSQRLSSSGIEMGEEVDHGSHCRVYLGKWQGRSVAVKKMHLYTTFEHERAILAEISMQPIDGVIDYLGWDIVDNTKVLIFPYMENGPLDYYLEKPINIPWGVRYQILYETAQGLSGLHALGIVHNDIKTANVILDGDLHAKMADVGGADSKYFKAEVTASDGWLAPERVRNLKNTSKAADVYAYGLIVWSVFTRKRPPLQVTASQRALVQPEKEVLSLQPFSETADAFIDSFFLTAANVVEGATQKQKSRRPSAKCIHAAFQKV